VAVEDAGERCRIRSRARNQLGVGLAWTQGTS
jgi:hypothetical protein